MLPKWLQCLRLDQKEARGWSFFWVSHSGGRGPNTWAIFHSFFRHISRKQDWKYRIGSTAARSQSSAGVTEGSLAHYITVTAPIILLSRVMGFGCCWTM